MRHATDLAAYSTEIAVGVAAFATGTATGIGKVMVGVAVIGAIGAQLWTSCANRACRRAVEQVIKDMRGRPGITDAAITRAMEIARDNRATIALDPAALAKTAKAGNFPDHATTLILDALPFGPGDYDARSLLEIALRRAIGICSENDTFDSRFKRQLLIEAAADHGVMLTLLEEIREGQERVETKINNMAEAVDEIATANRDLLEALAARFRIEGAFDLPTATLRAELEKRAEDYRRVLKEISDLKGTSERVDNIHAAAMEAMENYRLEEAKQLLRDARTILREEKLRPVLEQNAKLMVAEAEVELLDHNVDAAYTLLSAVADSFAAIDPLEPARKRMEFEQPLFDYGLRYGGQGFIRAADMSRVAMSLLMVAADRSVVADLQSNLATTLRNQAARTPGREGIILLEQAVEACSSALAYYKRDDHPGEWARLKQNLALTLETLGSRKGGDQGDLLLRQAIDLYRQALTIRTRANDPVEWARTTHNLCIAKRNFALRHDSVVRATLLQEAIDGCRAVLEVFQKDSHPTEWGLVMQNLGNALYEKATVTSGPTGDELLGSAIQTYEAVSQVRKPTEQPIYWAMTQVGLSKARFAAANRAAYDDSRTHLHAASMSIDEAIGIFERHGAHLQRKEAAELRARITVALADLDGGTA